jgi:hypothetical protein
MTTGDAGRLTAEQERLCIDITRRLRKCPAAVPFNEPVDPKKQNLPNYFKKIKNPQDLGTILQRLEAGEYTSVTNWECDIATVWSNAETFNGKDSVISAMAQHMAGRFQHLKRGLDSHSLTGWTKRLYSLREKADGLLGKCPPSLCSIIPRSLDAAAPPIVAPFTAREMSDFILKTAEIVRDSKDIEAIVSILRRNDPPINVDEQNLIIDVDQLSSQTLYEIRSYYERKQLSELAGTGQGGDVKGE